MRSRRTGRRIHRWIAAATLTAAVCGASTARARDALTLRVNDGFAEPSGLAAIVIRTYASKPISQGTVCFRTRRSGRSQAARPFSAVEGVKVFAQRRDGQSVAVMETSGGGQTIDVDFLSRSASINKTDGPLAVIYFRVSSTVSPGEEYEIEIDLGNTAILDSSGKPVQLAPRAGTLRIRHPSDPFEAEAEDDKIAPGERAELGVETFEPVAMASGQVGFTYDPAIAAGKPRVKLSKKHGKRRFKVDRSTAGLVFVTFRSPDSSWNLVPGEIVSIRLPTSRRVPLGTRSPVTIDPSLTFFVDPDGNLLPYEFENGAVRFTRDD